MRTRVFYSREGLERPFLEGPVEALSAEAQVFLEFIQEHMQPAEAEPHYKLYIVRVELREEERRI